MAPIRWLVVASAAFVLAASPAAAGAATVDLDGSFSYRITRPEWTGVRCPTGPGDECGVIQLEGLGAADYDYEYGPTFEPTGEQGCFHIDGTFTLTLQSDASTITGPLTGVFCAPGESGKQRFTPAYGNPQRETDTVRFVSGTGRFEGLTGTAVFSQRIAGAHFRGTLSGVLSG